MPRFTLLLLVIAATATPAMAQKASESEGAATEAVMGWYNVLTEGGEMMVHAREVEVITMPELGTSMLRIDGKETEIDLFTGVTFHGAGMRPGPESAVQNSSSSQSSETRTNPDGSVTETKSTSTTRTNEDGSTTTTTSSSSTTTHSDGSTEDADVVITRTTPSPIR